VTRPPPTRVFIAGSCVSRDTFALLDPERYALEGYVARQSLISAFTGPAADVPALPEHLSPFQRRMLAGDVAGDLPRRLRRAAGTVDLLLWDVVDERLGVYRLPDGSFVTRTPELIGTALHDHLERTARLVAFGSDEHLGLWRAAAGAWVEVLRRHDLLARTLVVAPPWATRSDDGSPVPTSFGLGAEQANRLSAPYLACAAALGAPVLTVPPDTAVAAAGHRWGLAPFHYADATYARLVAGVEDARSRLS
jgi:hypothetical protein